MRCEISPESNSAHILDRSFRYKPSSAVYIHMQKDHIRTLKILQSMSEFSGLRKYHTNPAAARAHTNTCASSRSTVSQLKGGEERTNIYIYRSKDWRREIPRKKQSKDKGAIWRAKKSRTQSIQKSWAEEDVRKRPKHTKCWKQPVY